jgi:bacillithiol biosynthesis cysteine-adding enzyme BshC
MALTVSASSSLPTRPEPLVAPGRLPPLPAAWLAGRDVDLLAPLRLHRRGSALPPAPAVDRQELATGLERANRSYGHPRATELAAKLADPATRVVVAGQQPGLFGGPLYTLLKMVAAARWAAEMEAAGEPAVAVFWVATEDHDWDEAAWAAVWTPDGARRLTLGPDPHPLVPLGMRTLGDGVTAALGELAALFPYEPYASWIATMGRWYRPDARFGEAFSRLAVALLGERCPLVLDSQLPELKVAEQPLLRRLVEQRREVAAALAGADTAIEGRGYPLQVHPQPGTSPLFVLAGAERRRIVWEGADATSGAWHSRGGDGSRPLAELLATVDGNPMVVSPGVLARPVLQDAALGTSLQVMGPGELSYLAQVAPLYTLLGVAAPAVALRPRALLVEERHLATLADLGVTPAQLLGGEAELQRALLGGDRGGADPVAPAAARILAELETLRGPSLAVDPNLERPWQKTEETIRTALDRFAEKVTRSRAQREEVGGRRLAALRDFCLPEATLHERVLAGAHFRGRYGEAVVDRLWELLDVDEPGVQLLPVGAAP